MGEEPGAGEESGARGKGAGEEEYDESGSGDEEVEEWMSKEGEERREEEVSVDGLAFWCGEKDKEKEEGIFFSLRSPSLSSLCLPIHSSSLLS